MCDPHVPPVGGVEAAIFERALATTPFQRTYPASTGSSMTSHLRLIREEKGRVHIVDEASVCQTVKAWPTLTLTGHTLPVSSVCVSGDGRHVVSGSRDNAIKVWEMSTGRLVQTLTGHTNYVSSVCVSGDGRHVVSGSNDNTIKVWEMSTGRLVQTLTRHTNYVSSVCVSGDGRHVVSGSYDKTIKVWEMSTGRLLQTLAGHTSCVYSVCVSGDGRHVVSGSGDKTIQIWEMSTGRLVQTFTGHTSPVSSVCVSGDGRHVVSGSYDKTIKVWEMSTGRLVQTFTGHTNYVSSVCVSGDGRHVVSGSGDKTIQIWEMSTGRLVQTFTGHTSPVYSVCVSGDGRHVVSGSKDNTIKVWEMSKGRLLFTCSVDLQSSLQIWTSPDHTASLVLAGDGAIQVWDGSRLTPFDPTPGSLHAGRDGNVYQYLETTRFARVLAHTGALNVDSVTRKLSADGRSLPARKFSNFIAASLLNLPEALDAFIRGYGNSGIDDPQPDTGMSALAYALVLGHVDVVRVLLRHGANPSLPLRTAKGSTLNATDLGLSQPAAVSEGWLPPSLSLHGYEQARQHTGGAQLFSMFLNNPSFSDALIRSTLGYLEHGAMNVPSTARKLNDVRRLRSSQEAVQQDRLVPVGVDLHQIWGVLEHHQAELQDQISTCRFQRDLMASCEQVLTDASSHRTSAAWTLDQPSVLYEDLAAVRTMLERLAMGELIVQAQQTSEEADRLELLVCGLPTVGVSDGLERPVDGADSFDSLMLLTSVSTHVDSALQSLSQWRSEVQGCGDSAIVDKTEQAAVVLQTRLRAVLDCFGQGVTVVDPSSLDIQSALGQLRETITAEAKYHSSRQDVLKASFPAHPLSLALQSMRDLKRARVREIQQVLDWHDRLLELQEKLEHATRLYSRLDYKHLYEVHHHIEGLRLDIEELRFSQRRRQRTGLSSVQGQEEQQQQREEQDIAEKKMRVKRLVRDLDTQKAILVGLAEVGFADAMEVVTKLGGIEWSALKLDDFEELERLATPGQRRMMFKAKMEGETVVLKEYSLHSPESWHQLQSELKLLGRVQHPHVMPLQAAFVSEDKFKAYAVFPFFSNGSLDVWIDGLRRSSSSGSISNTQWEAVWRQVLSGLQALHDRRIVHCDIKPSNIFVDANCRMVIGDFDISQDTSQRTLTLATLSRVAGTLGFIAPELLSTPPHPATPMVDMHAFGVTVGSVMTTTELQAGGALAELVKQCQNSNPQHRPTAAEALACPFFTRQVVQEKEELEKEAKHIAALQAEVFAAGAEVETKKGQLLKDQQELRSLLSQLEQDKRQAKKTAQELRQEQARIDALQRQVRAEQESVQKQTKTVARLEKHIEQERAHLQKIGRIPRVPPYWSTSKYDLSLFQKVDVTVDIKKEMQSLFDKCCNAQTLGHGRDQQQAGSYSRLKVHTVWRIENFKLWNKYVARKMELKSLGKGLKGGAGSGGSEVVSTDQHSWVRDIQLNGRINEKLLFHGTDSVVANIICEHGFDERVGALGGMFGAGIYFAEQCSKSDQYVRRDNQGLFYMFVSRVMLGTQVYHTPTSMSQIRRPPELPGQRGRCFDSVVFDANAGHHYREFILYDRTQAYPEFLIAYQRQ